MDEELEKHWDDKYSDGGAGVSWYQDDPAVSLELIATVSPSRSEAVIDVGGGASPLVGRLLALDYVDVTVIDISRVSLAQSASRNRSDGRVTYIHGDILGWVPQREYRLWHDRAVLHFLTEPSDVDRYRKVLGEALGVGGTAIIGVFSDDGPQYCSGLPVRRYSPVELAGVLGDRFEVVAQRRELHRTPAGAEQAFTWIAAKRT